jgi:hypothetical protein
LVKLKFTGFPTPLGQAAGVGIAPKFCAPPQASFAGGGPPLQLAVQGVWQAILNVKADAVAVAPDTRM